MSFCFNTAVAWQQAGLYVSKAHMFCECVLLWSGLLPGTMWMSRSCAQWALPLSGHSCLKIWPHFSLVAALEKMGPVPLLGNTIVRRGRGLGELALSVRVQECWPFYYSAVRYCHGE